MSPFDISPLLAKAIAGLIGVLLLLFIWRVTAGLRPFRRIVTSALLAVVAVGPIALFIWLGGGPLYLARTSPSAPPATHTEQVSKAPVAEAPEPASPPVTAAEPAPSPVPAPEPDRTAIAVQTPVPATKPEAATRRADDDLVPIFYGTDRAPAAEKEQPDYTWQRGQSLQLGRALVSVPRARQASDTERSWAIKAALTRSEGTAPAPDASTRFAMNEVKPLTKEEFLALVRERLVGAARFKEQALVFVHGYNMSFRHGIYRTAQLAYDLRFDGAAFLYSWPSGGDVASYTYDRDSTEQTEPYLREFMEFVVKETGAKRISVVAHNMGCGPVLKVLGGLKGSMPEGVALGEVVLVAPDVERGMFEKLAGQLKALARGVTLYATADDRAVAVSRRFHGGTARAGDVSDSGPLVVPGVDTIDASAWSLDGLGLNGAAYVERKALLTDIGRLIEAGARPPDMRSPFLERVSAAKGNYWRSLSPN